MGNTTQKPQGGMLINFDKPYYYPGDVVTGSIFLNISQQFDAKGLELTFKIKESVKWFDTETKRENKREFDEVTKQWKETPHLNHVKVERKDKNILYKNSSLIGTMMNNVLGFGQYAYPFQFVLPLGLPGSFEYYDETISANIKYIVSARTITWNNSTELQSTSVLVVRQSPQNFQYPTNLSDTKTIFTWCFMNRGTSTLNVSYPKNNFLQNETVQVICQLNNTRCSLNCHCIKLQLYQRITVKCHDNKKNHLGDTKYLNRCLSETSNNGLFLAGQETLKTLELQMSDPHNPTLRHLQKCKHIHLFKDPSNVSKLQATVKSRLIECGYYLRVSTEFASCTCCSGLPTIDIPVIIYIPEIMFDVNSYRPQNWNPQVMNMYQFNMPNQIDLNYQGIGNVNNNNSGMINNNMNNNNNNFNNNQNSGGMIQTSFEPIQVNNNQNSGGMIQTSFEPMQVNNNQNSGMIQTSFEPMQVNNNQNSGGMMMNGDEPFKKY